MDTTRTWLKAAALSTAAGLLLGISPAQASVVDPAVLFVGGNPITCTAPAGNTIGLGYKHGLKIDGYPSGSYNLVVDGTTVGSVNVTQTPGGIDWTSTFPIDAVIMKGSDQANLYPYIAPPSAPAGTDWNARTYTGSVMLDTDLNFPAGSSHVEFCFGDVPPPTISKTAAGSWTRYNHWTLAKTADPTSIRMFDGDSHDVGYTVTATKTATGSFTVSGMIEINDPIERGFTVDSVADSMVFAADPANPKNVFHPPLSCLAVDDASTVIYRCTYSITMNGETYAFLAAGGGGVNSAAATLSFNGATMAINTTQAFSFPVEPAASYGDTLDADDDMVDGSTDHTFSGSGSWNYTRTLVCPDNDGGNPNHVSGVFSTSASTNGSAGAQATVDVQCETVSVSKTANTAYRANYSWSGDKKIVVRPEDLTKEEKSTYCSLLTSGPYANNYACDDITVILNEHGVYDTVYQLNATRTAASESEFAVSGVITVSWPSGTTPVFSGDPTDTLHFTSGLPATQDATVSNCVSGATSLTCDYTTSLDGKRDGVNWASIVRPHVCYDAGGNAGACDPADSSTYQGSQAYAFGEATAQTDECVSVSDLFNDGGLNLGGSFSWLVGGNVCASQTWYRTGDVDPTALVKSLAIHADWAPTDFAQNACLFEVPNLLSLLSNDTQTGSSDEAVISVNVPSVCNQGCTLTQGYWKTHSKYGPAPYDSTWAKIGENTLFFHSGKSWITLFRTPPKGGDAYLQLAHQYMAARLNVEAGASVPASVASAMTSAEALFNAVGSSFNKTQTTEARSLAGVLGSYNEGALGPGHCSESPTRVVYAK
jgi:hypothetical protein